MLHGWKIQAAFMKSFILNIYEHIGLINNYRTKWGSISTDYHGASHDKLLVSGCHLRNTMEISANVYLLGGFNFKTD
jgi:hypothetical protein